MTPGYGHSGSRAVPESRAPRGAGTREGPGAKALFCTLGPASLNDGVIARLAQLGTTLFRLNLAHTRIEDLAGVIEFVQARTEVPLCLDTEGAQVRSGALAEESVTLEEHARVRLHGRPIEGDSAGFSLYPDHVVAALEVGDLVSVDFDAVLLQVIGTGEEGVVARVLNGGRIGRNKAVTLSRRVSLPPLTEKDREALAVGARAGIRHIALSFANRAEDVDTLRAAFDGEASVIAKIECVNGLANLDGIAARSDGVIIDRGDLSREVPIERIPAIQKHIIRRCKKAGVPVYVATNLLESMVVSESPTRAEVNDVYNTLADGADGLVLAAETAIGRYPVRCASMIAKLVQVFESGSGADADAYDIDPASMLVEPHGGRLIHREATAAELAEADGLRRLTVTGTDLMDCEQIAFGTYSPLKGFMTRDELESVLETHALPSGIVWPLPVVLQTTKDAAAGLAPGERIVLEDAGGVARAFLDLADIFVPDLDALAGRWFGTGAPDHPGLARAMSAGEIFLGGDVTLIRRQTSPYRHYEFTPAQTRHVFAHKGWGRVVGFHTRNVAHRVHEHIQIEGLERTHADGLYINPVIGPKKAGDFLPESIMGSYQLLIDEGVYPAGKVMLGSFATYSRYCGPREAVFTALCRKNMGCSHFIVGRDHTGVGEFYDRHANRSLFEELGDIGVTPVFFEPIGYDPANDSYDRLGRKGVLEPISGTQMRESLRAGKALPEWFVRGAVQKMLRAELDAGRPVFCP